MLKKSVLLAGATGLVGNEVLKLLAEHEQFDPLAIVTRRPISIPESVHQHQVDFDRLSDYSEKIRGDVVIIALGTTLKKAGSKEAFYKVDFSYCYEIARLARDNGAAHLLLISSMGADQNSRIFYSRVKGELEAAVQKLDYPAISIFRPSLLRGDRKEFRLREEFGKIFDSLFSFLLPAKYKSIHARTVASAMVNAALQDAEGVRIIESDEIKNMAKIN
ncbi:NAD(P)H-binding protein [candidate division KSB1 bacterium]|nr:NAD(P)H-binding protein [candidate division KSB1 bacterium]